MQVGSKIKAEFQCFAIPHFEKYGGGVAEIFEWKNQVLTVAKPVVFNWLEVVKIRGVLKRNKEIRIRTEIKHKSFWLSLGGLIKNERGKNFNPYPENGC